MQVLSDQECNAFPKFELATSHRRAVFDGTTLRDATQLLPEASPQ